MESLVCVLFCFFQNSFFLKRSWFTMLFSSVPQNDSHIYVYVNIYVWVCVCVYIYIYIYIYIFFSITGYYEGLP